MKSLRNIGVFIAFLICAAAAAALAPLTFTNSQSQTVGEIIGKLSKHHYRKLNIDDELSTKLLKNFLENLDSSKSYFLASDIAEFAELDKTLDDSLLAEDLTSAFTIFNRFRIRMEQRLNANIKLLESDFEFDFETEESLLLDNDQRHWPSSEAAAHDYWRKRMKDALLRLTLSGKATHEARALLIKRYTTQLKQLTQQDNEDAFQFFVNALTELYDPHTDYLSPRTLENFNIAMSLSLEGIGAVLQAEDEFTKVVRIVPGGPADKEASLRAGDKIISVAQGVEELTDVIGWRLDDVVELIRGKKDTLVRLEVLSGVGEANDKSKVITIVRDRVKLEEQAAKSEIIEIPSGADIYRVGVIKIPAFYMDFEAYRNRDPDFKSTTRDVQQLLIELEKADVQGIVLDLRNNGGGSLLEATALTDLFVDPGPVVQIRHANHRISRNQRSRRGPFYRGPLVVLINRLSASASEIFAGAIQDYGRGLVLGSTSFGKGTVQVMAPLKQGQLKFTESKFYRVSGDSTQHRGVIPDISFPSYYDLNDIGESNQAHALPWDRIHGVKHSTHNNFEQLLAELRQRHVTRVSSDPGWSFMLDEISQLEKQRSITQISLKKATREAMQKERELTLLSIENKRRQALGKSVFNSFEQWQQATEDEQDKARENPVSTDLDPILREAGNLLIDYVDLSKRATTQRFVADAIETTRSEAFNH